MWFQLFDTTQREATPFVKGEKTSLLLIISAHFLILIELNFTSPFVAACAQKREIIQDTGYSSRTSDE